MVKLVGFSRQRRLFDRLSALGFLIVLLGGGLPASARTVFHVVAHQDDDLYFQSPALRDSIRGGETSWTVYLTAGDANRIAPQAPVGSLACAGLAFHWQCRERGMQAAYAEMAGVANAWIDEPISVAGKSIVHRRLVAAPQVHLVFLRIESPAFELPLGTLERLFDGRVPHVSTVDDTIGQPEHFFSRSELISTLATLIETASPHVLRTLDPWCLAEPGGTAQSCIDMGWWGTTTVFEGDDHTEHVMAARFALAAHARAAGTRRVRLYRTYNTAFELSNLSPEEWSAVAAISSVYEQYDYGGAPNAWNGREIADGDMSPATGRIALRDPASPDPASDSCLRVGGNGAPGSELTLSPCSGNDASLFDASAKLLRSGGLCVTASVVGPATVEICDGRMAQTWTWWTNRRIRSESGQCLGRVAGVVRATDCVPDSGAWELRTSPPFVASPIGDFSTVDLGADPARYRSLRLGDVDGDGRADACGRRSDGYYCALAVETGFAPATRWIADFGDAQGWGPVSHGATMMLGDLDADGDADVCGRGDAGLLCALSDGTGGFAPVSTWTGAFGDAWGGEQAPVFDSLRMGDIDSDGDADVCAHRPGSFGHDIVCVRSLGVEFESVAQVWREGWPVGSVPGQVGRTMMLGDIDGDGSADLCERGSSGVFCATSSPTASRFERGAWRSLEEYSDSRGWSSQEAYWGSIRLADVDGDGRADLCGRGVSGVLCTFSVDGRFSKLVHHVAPAFSDAAGFSVSEQGTTLQLADVDGNGRADFCAAGASSILCARLPVPEPQSIELVSAAIVAFFVIAFRKSVRRERILLP